MNVKKFNASLKNPVWSMNQDFCWILWCKILSLWIKPNLQDEQAISIHSLGSPRLYTWTIFETFCSLYRSFCFKGLTIGFNVQRVSCMGVRYMEHFCKSRKFILSGVVLSSFCRNNPSQLVCPSVVRLYISHKIITRPFCSGIFCMFICYDRSDSSVWRI